MTRIVLLVAAVSMGMASGCNRTNEDERRAAVAALQRADRSADQSQRAADQKLNALAGSASVGVTRTTGAAVPAPSGSRPAAVGAARARSQALEAETEALRRDVARRTGDDRAHADALLKRVEAERATFRARLADYDAHPERVDADGEKALQADLASWQSALEAARTP